MATTPKLRVSTRNPKAEEDLGQFVKGPQLELFPKKGMLEIAHAFVKAGRTLRANQKRKLQ